MLVKTAKKNFPCQLLGNTHLQRGEWLAHTTEKDSIKLQACRFKDLKVEDFISTCSAALPGNPRKTKHHGNVPRPKVAEEYLQYAAAIDIHNHYPCGSAPLEDVWSTKNPIHKPIIFYFRLLLYQQLLGNETKQLHHQFKIAVANSLVNF